MDHDATRSILRFSRINDVISFKLSELIASYRYNICRLMIICHWPMELNAILSIWYWKCFLAGHSSLVMFRDGRARCKQHACAKWFESETMFESQALRLKVFAHSRTEVMSVSCLQLFFESALNTNSCLKLRPLTRVHFCYASIFSKLCLWGLLTWCFNIITGSLL